MSDSFLMLTLQQQADVNISLWLAENFLSGAVLLLLPFCNLASAKFLWSLADGPEQLSCPSKFTESIRLLFNSFQWRKTSIAIELSWISWRKRLSSYRTFSFSFSRLPHASIACPFIQASEWAYSPLYINISLCGINCQPLCPQRHCPLAGRRHVCLQLHFSRPPPASFLEFVGQ